MPEKTEKKSSSMGWFHMVTIYYNKLFLSVFLRGYDMRVLPVSSEIPDLFEIPDQA